MRICRWSLVFVCCLLLTGCASILDREYRVVELHSSKFWESDADDILRARMDKILKIRLDVEKIMLGAAFIVEGHTMQFTGLGNEDIAVGDAVKIISGDDDTVSADEEEDFVKPMRMQMMV